MRVYLPLTLPALEAAHRAGRSGPESGAQTAYAVTPGLREWCGTEDSEELEYAALSCAAEASLRLLAAAPEAPRRRVVLAAEIPDAAVTPAPEETARLLGEVRVEGAVRMSQVAAVHADAEDAEQVVTTAAGAVTAADDGDEGAAATADRAGDRDLLWFATQEIPGLLS
ncbi:hypothetical protein [Streptomyces sp. HNM0574]|uniref:DUF6912 family protein n=1 Tax=Streptomyces sp. HNM0574 TaxID=2714954 RepID=UPI00146A1243|nr:hypothetical protein [Streptomyces sp. HNM0574]NLU67392.1 hypothetical protein [Streptomyces sp. HNM0574]